MTEADWRNAANPGPMLEFLYTNDLISDRKHRLFDCACVRRLWHLLDDARSRKAVEIAEAFAESRVSRDELIDAQSAALAAADEEETSRSYAARAAAAAAWEFRSGADPTGNAASALAWEGLDHTSRTDRGEAKKRLKAERRVQAKLLREIVNPFQHRLGLEPTESLTEAAAAIYRSGDFSKLPALGEALQRLGCAYPKMLAHCWLPGPHVRGCWVVDKVLGYV